MSYLGTPFIVRVQTQFDVASSTVLANITDLVVPVSNAQGPVIVGGGVYDLYAELFTTSDVAAGVKAAFGGTATAVASSFRSQIQIVDGAAAVPVTNGRSTALGTGAGVTAVTVAFIQLYARIKINVAGTLAAMFAQNASNAAASSVLTGSKFQIARIYNTLQQPWQDPATS
jgi:hypothetical protein